MEKSYMPNEIYVGSDYRRVFDFLVAQTKSALRSNIIYSHGNNYFNVPLKNEDKGYISEFNNETNYNCYLRNGVALDIVANHESNSVTVKDRKTRIISEGLDNPKVIREEFVFPIGDALVQTDIKYYFNEWLKLLETTPVDQRQQKYDDFLETERLKNTVGERSVRQRTTSNFNAEDSIMSHIANLHRRISALELKPQ